MSAVIDHLSAVPLFGGMPQSALEAVAGLASETQFADGDTVTRLDPCRALFTPGSLELVAQRRVGQPVPVAVRDPISRTAASGSGKKFSASNEVTLS